MLHVCLSLPGVYGQLILYLALRRVQVVSCLGPSTQVPGNIRRLLFWAPQHRGMSDHRVFRYLQRKFAVTDGGQAAWKPTPASLGQQRIPRIGLDETTRRRGGWNVPPLELPSQRAIMPPP